jgi:hypothetical protein
VIVRVVGTATGLVPIVKGAEAVWPAAMVTVLGSEPVPLELGAAVSFSVNVRVLGVGAGIERIPWELTPPTTSCGFSVRDNVGGVTVTVWLID